MSKQTKIVNKEQIKYEIRLPKRNSQPFDEDAANEEQELTDYLFGSSKIFVESLQHDNKAVESNIKPDNKKRKPMWEDEDDEIITVGKALQAQQRKLPKGGLNDPKTQYTTHLSQKYKSLVGTPKWASLDTSKDSEANSDDDLFQTCGFIQQNKSTKLLPNLIEYKKVKDLNSETYTEGKYINAVEFHPTSSVALVAGMSGIASFIAVDGKSNSKLQSVKFENFSILSAQFKTSGNEAIFGSRLPFYYSYDLLSSKSLKIPLPKGITQCKNFLLSPCGNFMAIAGKWGEIHLLSVHSNESIAILKQNSEATALAFNANGSMLCGHSDTGEVTIWDVNSRKMQHRFIDEGCLQGTCIKISPCGKYVATGSAQGVVNIYNAKDTISLKAPKPRKSVFNLTTSIKDLIFNSTSEILAFASMDIENSARLLHLGNETVFSNFPNFQQKLGHISCLNFSPNGGYLALGNNQSIVHLYRLKYYKNY